MHEVHTRYDDPIKQPLSHPAPQMYPPSMATMSAGRSPRPIPPGRRRAVPRLTVPAKPEPHMATCDRSHTFSRHPISPFLLPHIRSITHDACLSL